MQPTRIQKLFEGLAGEGRAALVAYVTAGDPSPEQTPGIVEGLIRGGADLIELGVPFSDPIADGPVIQRGAERALRAGTTVGRVLEMARAIRGASEAPLLLFSYMNPLLRYGFERLAADAVAAGVDGVLLTDLSVEEAAPHVAALRAAGLDTVFLAAPTSPEKRLALVARYSSGFIYLVSRTGVTGVEARLSDSVPPLVKAMRAHTTLPLVVGFGISTPEQAAATARVAEGVAIGSAFVRFIEQHRSEPELPALLEGFTRPIAAAIRSSKS